AATRSSNPHEMSLNVGLARTRLARHYGIYYPAILLSIIRAHPLQIDVKELAKFPEFIFPLTYYVVWHSHLKAALDLGSPNARYSLRRKAGTVLRYTTRE